MLSSLRRYGPRSTVVIGIVSDENSHLRVTGAQLSTSTESPFDGRIKPKGWTALARRRAATQGCPRKPVVHLDAQ